MAEPIRVFLSYAAAERSYRDLLVGQLHAHGTVVGREVAVLDVTGGFANEGRDIDTGLKAKLRREIARADGVLVILGPAAGRSRWVSWAVWCARDLGRPSLGLLVASASSSALPPELRGVLAVAEWRWEAVRVFLSDVARHPPSGERQT